MIAAFSMAALSTAAFADPGCRNVRSRCAIQIGGRCDPVSGRWEWGAKFMAGGSRRAFNACVQANGGELTREERRLAMRPARGVSAGRARFAERYITCSEFAIERGYSNRAPGKLLFIHSCMVRTRHVAKALLRDVARSQ